MKIKNIAVAAAFLVTSGTINPEIVSVNADDSYGNPPGYNEFVKNNRRVSGYFYDHFIKTPEKTEVDEELFEKYLKYSFYITDTTEVSDETMKLCRFVFETERAYIPYVSCSSAREAIYYSKPQLRASFDKPETISRILGSQQNVNDIFVRNFDEPLIRPDILYGTYWKDDVSEYWMNDEGTERLIVHPYDFPEHIIIYNEKPSDMENILPSEDGKSFIFYEEIYPDEYAEEVSYESHFSDIWEYKILHDGTAVLTGCSLPKLYDAVPVEDVMILPETIDGIPVSGITTALDSTGITKLVIPENYIHIMGFSGLPYLEEIEINAPDTSIRSGLCVSCPSLKYAKFNVHDIGGSVFTSCNKIKTIEIEKADIIGRDAFSQLPDLSKVILPDTLKCIGQNAFARTSVTELVIPESVEIVGALYSPYIGKDGEIVDPYVSGDILIAAKDCKIISCYSTEAHAYALENKVEFSPLDDLIYGDSNNDGVINSLDLVFLKQHLLGVSMTGYESDVNKDGIINILDFISLKRNILH